MSATHLLRRLPSNILSYHIPSNLVESEYNALGRNTSRGFSTPEFLTVIYITERRCKMAELILTFILKFILLGLGYYLVHSVFSKKPKDFHFSADQDRIEVGGSFYKE